jgi:hypothetical protein
MGVLAAALASAAAPAAIKAGTAGLAGLGTAAGAASALGTLGQGAAGGLMGLSTGLPGFAPGLGTAGQIGSILGGTGNIVSKAMGERNAFTQGGGNNALLNMMALNSLYGGNMFGAQGAGTGSGKVDPAGGGSNIVADPKNQISYDPLAMTGFDFNRGMPLMGKMNFPDKYGIMSNSVPQVPSYQSSVSNPLSGFNPLTLR